MRCPDCHHTIPDTEAFCAYCGARVDSSTAVEREAVPRSSVWWRVAAGAALLLALAAATQIVLPGDAIQPASLPDQDQAEGEMEPEHVLEGHEAGVRDVAFAADGEILASGAEDGTIKLWEVGSGRWVRDLSLDSEASVTLAFSPREAVLVAGRYGGIPARLTLWDVGTGEVLRSVPFKGVNTVRSVAFSPDGDLVAVGKFGSDANVQVLDAAAGEVLWTAENEEHVGGNRYSSGSNVHCVDFSPDGRLVASASSDVVKLWDAAGGELLDAMEHATRVWTVAFSPDGSLLASGAMDSTIRLWRVSDGALLRSIEGHKGDVYSLAFSPDGKTLLSGSRDTSAKAWRVSDGTLLHALEHEDEVRSVAFSPDGSTLASGSVDGTVRLWKLP